MQTQGEYEETSVVNREKRYKNNGYALISHINIGNPLGGHSVIVIEMMITEEDLKNPALKQKFKPDKAKTLMPGAFVGQFDLIATLQRSGSWWDNAWSYIPFYGATQRVTGERKVEIRDFISNKLDAKDYTKCTSATWLRPKEAMFAVINAIHTDMDNIPDIEFFIFGKDSIYGKGGNNCTTWAEKKLMIAGAGNQHVLLDSSSASPEVHIRTSKSN